MTFIEKLREFLRRTREALDNRRAEGSLKWIDNILYYISGKTRVIRGHGAGCGRIKFIRDFFGYGFALCLSK